MTPAELLIRENVSLAEGLAGRMARNLPHWADYDSLRGAALVGLWQAAESYDSRPGTKFTTWAYGRIFGAVVDEVRRLDPNPRARTDEAKEARVSFCGLEGLDDVAGASYPGDDAHLDAMDSRSSLAALSDRDRRVVSARLVGFDCREIARALGVSEGRVSEVSRRGLRRMQRAA
jgi:RNA polymerase sigma factor (sigma-70 family)